LARRAVLCDCRIGVEEAIRRAIDPAVLMQRVADEAVTLVEGAEGVIVGSLTTQPG